MVMSTEKHFLIFLVLLALIYQGCAPKRQIGNLDQYGCPEQPDVFTSNGLDVEIAKFDFGKIVSGGINIKDDPKIFSLASQIIRNAQYRDTFRCLAKHRDNFSDEQVAYFDRLTAFMATNPPPTPEQFLLWQEKNPFPSKDEGNKKDKNEINKLEQNEQKKNTFNHSQPNNPWTRWKCYSLIPIPLSIGCYFLGQNFDQKSNDYHEQYKKEIWDKNKTEQLENKANDYNAYKEYSYDVAIGLGIVSLVSFPICWYMESRYAKNHDLRSKYGTEIDIERFPQEVKFSLVLRY